MTFLAWNIINLASALKMPRITAKDGKRGSNISI